MNTTLLALLSITLLGLSACGGSEPKQAPIYVPEYQPLQEVEAAEPDYPSCAIASDGELCEDTLGKLIIKVQPCFLASSGEVCEEYGKMVTKP